MSAAAQRGFGLIEILITLVVIAFGVMAHLTFQRVTFHEAGLAVSRAKAAEVAQEKLEDLTAFGCLKTGDCAFAFQDIATDAGGNLVSGSQLELPAAAAFTVDNTSYTRHWTVTDYWYTATNSAPTTTAPTGAPLPGLKAVTVNITWTDTNGDDQNLSLSTLIAGADPAAAARAFQ
ncbi:MAG: type IV pilus modification PilV family protein [Stenotrophobium sp.]